MDRPKYIFPHKTYLRVPFSEKDRAKALGARWDPAIKAWFVPPERALWSFVQWLPRGELRTDLEAYQVQEKERGRLTDEWYSLPPRNMTSKEMLAILGWRPTKTSGFCGMCDTHVTNEWCFNGEIHIAHFIERVDGPLRPSEWKLLLDALQREVI